MTLPTKLHLVKATIFPVVIMDVRVGPYQGVYQVTLVVKNLPAKAGDVRDAGSISGSGRSPGGGQGNPLQYSCLENSMERGS